MQMLVTTYVPEYTIFGVSADAYTVRPGQMDEALTAEEQDLPICDFNHVLLYDEKTDKFYNMKFEEKGRPVIPNFLEAIKLNTYELQLPDVGEVENPSLKKNSDSPIVISSKGDVEKHIGYFIRDRIYHKERRDRYSSPCGKYYQCRLYQ